MSFYRCVVLSKLSVLRLTLKPFLLLRQVHAESPSRLIPLLPEDPKEANTCRLQKDPSILRDLVGLRSPVPEPNSYPGSALGQARFSEHRDPPC